MYILRLPAQVQLGHVIMKSCACVAVRKVEVSFFTVQVARTDLGQIFKASIQIVVVLKKNRK